MDTFEFAAQTLTDWVANNK